MIIEEYRSEDIVQKLLDAKNLSPEEAEHLMLEVLEGRISQRLMKNWLTAGNAKPYTAMELASYARTIRSKAKTVSLDIDAMDTCGTGGDSSHLLNISTLAGIVLASLGVPIAKHGNRSVSSKFGSADLLEAFGYPLDETPKQIQDRIQSQFFGFMYAPNHHPAMKQVAPVRKELGVRTVFNILGPLCSPAMVRVQLMGVYSGKILDLVAKTLRELNVHRALVVSSKDGLDEISPVHETEYRLISEDHISSGLLRPPEELAVKSLDELRVSGPEDACRKAEATLKGSFQPGLEMLALNAAAGLFIWKLHKKEITSIEPQKFINENFKIMKKQIQSKKAWELTKTWRPL